MSAVNRIVRLRITLDDIEPPVWRVVEVPLTIRLTGLHAVIQVAMPFDDYHLFDFRVGEHRYALPDPDWPDPKTLDAEAAELRAVLGPGVEQFSYTYDFGDDWRHTVTVEAIEPADPAVAVPASSMVRAGRHRRMSAGLRASRNFWPSSPNPGIASVKRCLPGAAGHSIPRLCRSRSSPSELANSLGAGLPFRGGLDVHHIGPASCWARRLRPS